MKKQPIKEPQTMICPNHQDRPIPLLATMAFIGAELWCPACGHTQGLFDGAPEIALTDELKKIHHDYTEKTKEFLSAKATFSCSSFLYKGKRIHHSELPEKEKQLRKDIIENFKYDIDE